MTGEQKRILLVEDEPHLAFNLEFNLVSEGYDVVLATNGRAALDKFTKNGPFDLIILDVMLPEVDGFEVARTIRSKDAHTGILMLTARASEHDVIKGLETGADDYITKPFHLQELLLRVKRMARRAELLHAPQAAGAGAESINCGPFKLDTEALELETPKGKFTLTALETGILREFLLNPGRVLSREHLLKTVWGAQGNIETRTVDNFIMRIRKFIETDPSSPVLLESVRGRGYRLTMPESEEA